MASRRSYDMSCVAQKNELSRREDAKRSRRPTTVPRPSVTPNCCPSGTLIRVSAIVGTTDWLPDPRTDPPISCLLQLSFAWPASTARPAHPPFGAPTADEGNRSEPLGRPFARVSSTFRCSPFAPENRVSARCSCLQLALELVEKAPIGVFGDDLLRARFDETHLVQAQRVKPQRVLRIILAPFVVAVFAQRLQGIFITIGEASRDDAPGRALPIGRTEIGRLQHGAQRPPRRNRISAHVVAISAKQGSKNTATTGDPALY